MAEETQKTEQAAPAAKAEKAPPVESKPFAEFMKQDCFPALQNALAKYGINDLELQLIQDKIPSQTGNCWQVIGKWLNGKRQFNLYFPKEDIQADRAFSCAASGSKVSILEPFLIDERKITLDLLVFGVIQRLNGQKWLSLN